MLVLAALIYAGTWSTNVSHSHGSFPAGGKGTVFGTTVQVERTFPGSRPGGQAVQNHLRELDSEKRAQLRCPTIFRLGSDPSQVYTLYYHPTGGNGCSPAPDLRYTGGA